MLLPWTTSPSPTRNRDVASWSLGALFAILCLCLDTGYCMSGGERLALRNEAQDLFYHGYNNYLAHAFPEDELRPLSCSPLTRDRANPGHVEVNDVLGNYSLTLVDSLSTLAILASSAGPDSGGERNLKAFQDGVKMLVELYGDGSAGEAGQGKRERGFDLDSKVQVFESVIRGVGGLVSAHLFAVGELPIRGYEPKKDLEAQRKVGKWGKRKEIFKKQESGIRWSNGLVYDDQLLRLAADLGERLLPAFFTTTGIPYPRVNLRHGVPFYPRSILVDPDLSGTCDAEQGDTQEEITETCSAGAGSLVLEFTVLSRLTGDGRFEKLAKRAFWAVWERRSAIGLVGSGIDAETGEWVGSYTGVGAGIDSFYEYAFKSHVLLANDRRPLLSNGSKVKGMGRLDFTLSAEQDSSDGFLTVWTEAHAAIKRHIYRGRAYQHPHYIQGDLFSGATRAFWIDSLSAFYPGLLTVAGELDEAIETQLLLTALWTRYSALPERWNLGNGEVEGGLGWWNGRPELIESNYHLYRATHDPWYLHVGEMALRDIKRRCWTPCGWAGIQDVQTGQLSDRMESYFLSETAKYLFLLFDEEHPLNHLDAGFVFSTEGHPLILPRNVNGTKGKSARSKEGPASLSFTCPKAPEGPPLGLSYTAARDDIFHAASLARLHLRPARQASGSLQGEYGHDHPSVSLADIQPPSNYTYYPWTLPASLVAHNATSAPLSTRPTFDISFPPLQDFRAPSVPVQRVKQGILINHIGGVRMGMIQDVPVFLPDRITEGYRVHTINNFALGKDEKVFLAGDATSDTLNPTDPNFTRIRDPELFDLVIDLAVSEAPTNHTETVEDKSDQDVSSEEPPSTVRSTLSSLVAQLNAFLHDPRQHALSLSNKLSSGTPHRNRFYIPGITATGVGAAPLPDWQDAPSRTAQVNGQPQPATPLVWKSIYATDELCSHQLSRVVARTHQLLVIKRGGCSFSKKISNIPAFALDGLAIQLVVLVDFEDKRHGDEGNGGEREEVFDEASLIRPLLDVSQKTAKGVARRNPIPVVMVGGGERVYEVLKSAVGMGIKRRYRMESRGVRIVNLVIV